MLKANAFINVLCKHLYVYVWAHTAAYMAQRVHHRQRKIHVSSGTYRQAGCHCSAGICACMQTLFVYVCVYVCMSFMYVCIYVGMCAYSLKDARSQIARLNKVVESHPLCMCVVFRFITAVSTTHADTEIPTIIDPSTTINYPSAPGSIIVGITVRVIIL